MAAERDDGLARLLEDWFFALESGAAPTPAEHCAARPDLLPEFERLLGRSAEVDRLFRAPTGPSTAATRAPELLGEFEVLEPIGSGGVGEVWLARQTSLQRLVALKVVRRRGDARTRARLRREAEVAASLEHPGIVPIYGVGDDDERAWIAMKWLTGPALDGLELPLEPLRAARIAAAAARALHAAHLAGIVHRDIKPSNIVLDGDQPCIVDFGLARDTDHAVRTTLEGHVAGTLLYMSPEQLRSSRATATLDPRTDVYSLGATLYELLAGTPPFADDNPARVVDRILNAEPAAPPVGRDLATIVLRALDKDRERRFPTALAFAEDLDRFVAGEPILSRPNGLTTRLWKLTRRHRVAASLLAVTLLVALGLAVSLVSSMRRQQIARSGALERARSELAAGSLATARSLLEPLIIDDPTGEARALQRRPDARDRLEALLDAVQARSEDVHPDELRAAAAALADADALLPDSPHRLALELARPLALALAGDTAAALALAAPLPPGRGRDALLAALRGQQGDWQLRERAAPIEHLFTVLALRLANRPLAERRAELVRAIPHYAAYPRLRLQHALLLINEGQHTAAVESLRGQATPDGRYPRMVRRLLLREALQLGEADEVRYHLDCLEDSEQYPFASWTAADAAGAIDARYWLDRPTGELLTKALARWPDDWMLTVLQARELRERDLAAAVGLLQRAAGELARTPRQRQEAGLERLYYAALGIDVFRFPGTDPTADGAEALRALATAAARFAADAVDQEFAHSGTVVAARAALAAGDWQRARSALAPHADDRDVELVLEEAQQACTRA
ncbi:MAG: serine/threonine protein kinase, partial [Planctomycetes bacterium]|nr:serine/threonine protein kinase [Planctomycetota bacterium]